MKDRDASGSSRPGPGPLGTLFRAHWRRVGVTYALFNVESLLQLAQPLVLGRAIDGLLDRRWLGLLPLVGQHLAWLAVATARQLYDTRTFTSIYAETATRLVGEQRRAGVGISAVSARSSLSRELVEFFEHDLRLVFAVIYGVVGALVMLLGYDTRVAGFCLMALVPLLFLNRRLSSRSLVLNRALNDHLEREVGVIEGGEPGPVGRHYRRLARRRVALSDLEAYNFLWMEFFVLALLVGSLASYCTRSEADAGNIYAVFAYVQTFVHSLDGVPQIIQRLARLKDIGERVVGEPIGGEVSN